jgi:hypothetical protein
VLPDRDVRDLANDEGIAGEGAGPTRLEQDLDGFPGGAGVGPPAGRFAAAGRDERGRKQGREPERAAGACDTLRRAGYLARLPREGPGALLSEPCTEEAIMRRRIRIPATSLLVAALVAAIGAPPVRAAGRPELVREAHQALQSLYAKNTAARLLGEKARAVLVFPSIYKAGFLFGGQIGDGVLEKNGKAVGFYNSVAASYGLQAGVQVFGYALFFMNDKALAYLDKSEGFEIGVGPSIVVVDAGLARTLTSTTITQDVYAFIFDQKGLMAGIGLQGSKITKLD